MTVKYGKFEMPTKITMQEGVSEEGLVRFVAEPFERGFGHTVGNSLRRMLLGSLEAPAIISIRIEGVSHEYQAVEGIIEDVTNIILNFKGGLLRRIAAEDARSAHDSRVVTNVIEVTKAQLEKAGGQVSITMGDVVSGGLYEVVNPDHHLFTVTQPMKRQVDLKVMTGRGYVTAERLSEEFAEGTRTADEILIDAAFSPVRLVNYFVEHTRVGQDTDFDRLILDVQTDGRVSAQEALSFAAQIGLAHFQVFDNIKTHSLVFEEETTQDDSAQDEIMDKLALRIDEIELSVRSTNCLSGANISTIAELVTIPERRMLEFRNFGKKSLTEIKAKLHEMGLSLGMDLSGYGIDEDNVRESIEEYVEERNKRREQLTQ